MTMTNNEAIEVITHFDKHIRSCDEYGYLIDGELMEAHLMAAKALRNGWIPVSERLPEQHSSVIVYKKTKRFSMLHYSSALGFHFYDSEWGDVTVDDVTHWMPLPEPPKENEYE